MVNAIGYKAAKRQFTMKIRNIIISMIIVECGRGSLIFFKT